MSDKPRIRVAANYIPTAEKQWYDLPITGGAINGAWGWNWWQKGYNPVNGGAVAAVHAAVDAYAQTIATLWGEHFTYDADLNTKRRVKDSALARVLHKPNTYQTRSAFMYNAIKTMLLEGNSYILGLRDDRNLISELHIMPRGATQPYVEPETRTVFYAVGGNPLVEDQGIMVPQRDMMHLRLFTPRHPLVGVSPVENAAMSVAANAAISGHQATFFRNMSRPSGVLSTEQKLNREQMVQLRSAWEEQSKGMDSGGIPILGSGIKWEPMSISSQDAQIVDAFNMTVNDIARAFRVPLPLIQQHDQGSTYNNVEQLIAHWLSGGLGFLLEHIELEFDRFFDLPRNQFTEFDTETLLRTEFEKKVDGYSKLVQGGIMTPNEARSKFGSMDPVENGDTAYMQQQMVPLGYEPPEPAPAPAAPALPPPEDDEEPESAKEIDADVTKALVVNLMAEKRKRSVA